MSKEIKKVVYVTVDIYDALYDLEPDEKKEVAQEMAEECLNVPELIEIAEKNGDVNEILDQFSDNQLRTYMEDVRGFVCRLA